MSQKAIQKGSVLAKQAVENMKAAYRKAKSHTSEQGKAEEVEEEEEDVSELAEDSDADATPSQEDDAGVSNV